MVVVATDAPLENRNLKRLAKRAILGIARTGGFNSNTSGDYVICFSTAAGLRVPHLSDSPMKRMEVLRNDGMSPLFLAAVEATEEAIYNSMFKAQTMKGRDGNVLEALPLEKLKKIIQNEKER